MSIRNHLPKLPSNKETPIGCIGAGFIMADCHLVAYRNAGFNPVAICSRSIEKAESVAKRHSIKNVYSNYQQLLDDESIEVIDIAVPPDNQFSVIEDVVKRKHIRGILAQKPLGVHYTQAKKIVEICDAAGIRLCVNQNMRYDQSVRTCKSLVDSGVFGDPVLATIDMRAIPHWMPWQERQGWVTLRIMSIHHLDTFRYWLGDPTRIFASCRPDPRTNNKFEHRDGICLYILEFENGARASAWDDVWAGPSPEGSADGIGINWRYEGTHGMARGTIGWPEYPKPTPSTLEYTTIQNNQIQNNQIQSGQIQSDQIKSGQWEKSDWNEVWFPDAFVGPMSELLCSLETGETPNLSGTDNLKTMALVDAAYRSIEEHRAVEIAEIVGANS